MEPTPEKDAHKRLLLIKKFDCNELFFMHSTQLKEDIWKEIEIEIELKECSDCPEKNA